MFKYFAKKVSNKKGFTLIELIVVIAILGILAAVAVPKFSGFRDNAAEKADRATAATIANAVRLYNMDGGGFTGGTDFSGLNGLIETDTTNPQKPGETAFFVEINAEGDILVHYANTDSTKKDNTQLYPTN